MKMKNIPYEDATDDQIRDFATTLDLNPGASATRAELIALVETAWPQSFILAVDYDGLASDTERLMRTEQTGSASVVAQQRIEGGLGDSDPRVKVKVATTTYVGGNQPVSVGVNGRVVVIQRGVVVDLPWRYYLALMDAIRVEVTATQTGPTTFDTVETEYTNYPVQVVDGFPSREEIRAFRERTDNELMPA